MAETKPKPKPEEDEDEELEREYKRLRNEELREKLATAADRKERTRADRERQLADFKKNERVRLHKQTICKHRKGGRNNQFAKGTAAEYSVILNTYPTGQMCFTCTRCGKEVWKPEKKLKKSEPKRYAAMWEEWQKWAEYPTDNSPSGGKIFEIEEAA